MEVVMHCLKAWRRILLGALVFCIVIYAARAGCHGRAEAETPRDGPAPARAAGD